MSIYHELQAAAHCPGQNEGESAESYLSRLVRAVSRTDDDSWAALSKAAQDWNNTQALRLKEGKGVEACPGFGEHDSLQSKLDSGELSFDPGYEKHADGSTHVTEISASDLDAVAEEQRIAEETGAPAPIANKPTAPSPYKPIILKQETASDAVRAIVIDNPAWTQSQIKDELFAQGRNVGLNTIATVRSMTLACIDVARRMGRWQEQ
jgi:hypothetical protein